MRLLHIRCVLLVTSVMVSPLVAMEQVGKEYTEALDKAATIEDKYQAMQNAFGKMPKRAKAKGNIQRVKQRFYQSAKEVDPAQADAVYNEIKDIKAPANIPDWSVVAKKAGVVSIDYDDYHGKVLKGRIADLGALQANADTIYQETIQYVKDNIIAQGIDQQDFFNGLSDYFVNQKIPSESIAKQAKPYLNAIAQVFKNRYSSDIANIDGKVTYTDFIGVLHEHMINNTATNVQQAYDYTRHLAYLAQDLGNMQVNVANTTKTDINNALAEPLEGYRTVLGKALVTDTSKEYSLERLVQVLDSYEKFRNEVVDRLLYNNIEGKDLTDKNTVFDAIQQGVTQAYNEFAYDSEAHISDYIKNRFKQFLKDAGLDKDQVPNISDNIVTYVKNYTVNDFLGADYADVVALDVEQVTKDAYSWMDGEGYKADTVSNCYEALRQYLNQISAYPSKADMVLNNVRKVFGDSNKFNQGADIVNPVENIAEHYIKYAINNLSATYDYSNLPELQDLISAVHKNKVANQGNLSDVYQVTRDAMQMMQYASTVKHDALVQNVRNAKKPDEPTANALADGLQYGYVDGHVYTDVGKLPEAADIAQFKNDAIAPGHLAYYMKNNYGATDLDAHEKAYGALKKALPKIEPYLASGTTLAEFVEKTAENALKNVEPSLYTSEVQEVVDNLPYNLRRPDVSNDPAKLPSNYKDLKKPLDTAVQTLLDEAEKALGAIEPAAKSFDENIQQVKTVLSQAAKAYQEAEPKGQVDAIRDQLKSFVKRIFGEAGTQDLMHQVVNNYVQNNVQDAVKNAEDRSQSVYNAVMTKGDGILSSPLASPAVQILLQAYIPSGNTQTAAAPYDFMNGVGQANLGNTAEQLATIFAAYTVSEILEQAYNARNGGGKLQINPLTLQRNTYMPYAQYVLAENKATKSSTNGVISYTTITLPDFITTQLQQMDSALGNYLQVGLKNNNAELRNAQVDIGASGNDVTSLTGAAFDFIQYYHNPLDGKITLGFTDDQKNAYKAGYYLRNAQMLMTSNGNGKFVEANPTKMYYAYNILNSLNMIGSKPAVLQDWLKGILDDVVQSFNTQLDNLYTNDPSIYSVGEGPTVDQVASQAKVTPPGVSTPVLRAIYDILKEWSNKYGANTPNEKPTTVTPGPKISAEVQAVINAPKDLDKLLGLSSSQREEFIQNANPAQIGKTILTSAKFNNLKAGEQATYKEYLQELRNNNKVPSKKEPLVKKILGVS